MKETSSWSWIAEWGGVSAASCGTEGLYCHVEQRPQVAVCLSQLPFRAQCWKGRLSEVTWFSNHQLDHMGTQNADVCSQSGIPSVFL
jgi:hypothetical protein